jgi:hypothetical protein
MSRTFNDYAGQRIGKLTVLHRGEDQLGGAGDIRVQWVVRCDCGTEFLTASRNLKRSKYKCCSSCRPIPGKTGDFKSVVTPNGFVVRINTKKEAGVLG